MGGGVSRLLFGALVFNRLLANGERKADYKLTLHPPLLGLASGFGGRIPARAGIRGAASARFWERQSHREKKLFTKADSGLGRPVNNLAGRYGSACVCRAFQSSVRSGLEPDPVDKLWITNCCRAHENRYAVRSSLKEPEWKAADARMPLEIPR